VRGTFDILWSCIITLLICTWTVQHLNVPPPRRKGTKTIWQGLVGMLKGGRKSGVLGGDVLAF
jgi:hypothetical protein